MNTQNNASTINLYIVHYRHDDWGCFVFESTHNKARARMVGFFEDDHKYTDFNARLVRKDVGGDVEVCDLQCERLTELGVEYCDEDKEHEGGQDE